MVIIEDKSSEKLVMCGYPGCRNMFHIDKRKGIPFVPYCGHHVRIMERSIKSLVRKRTINHG